MTDQREPADVEELGPATIAWTESYRVRSKLVDQDFLIEVACPPGAMAADRKLPVVYVLDGNTTFSIAATAARSIQAGPFPLPATLVVGVGYFFEKPEDRVRAGVLRVRDLTPCSDPLLEAQYPGRGLAAGGASAFLDFLQTELKPLIESHYPVQSDDQTLVGSSLAGLFALNTLCSEPGAFNRYVAISPAIYWANGKLFEHEAELAQRIQDLPAHVFLGAGGLEEGHDAKQGFVSNIYRMEALLRMRNYPSLKLERRIFDGETHMSVYPGAFTYGLASVFGGYRDMHDWSRWLNRGQ